MYVQLLFDNFYIKNQQYCDTFETPKNLLNRPRPKHSAGYPLAGYMVFGTFVSQVLVRSLVHLRKIVLFSVEFPNCLNETF